jgi:hypothetical protein
LGLRALRAWGFDPTSRVQARPGATGCGYEIVFTFYGLGFPSPHLDMPGLGQGFKGYKMLFSVVLCSIVWIGFFHPLGETLLLIHITILYNPNSSTGQGKNEFLGDMLKYCTLYQF